MAPGLGRHLNDLLAAFRVEALGGLYYEAGTKMYDAQRVKEAKDNWKSVLDLMPESHITHKKAELALLYMSAVAERELGELINAKQSIEKYMKMDIPKSELEKSHFYKAAKSLEDDLRREGG